MSGSLFSFPRLISGFSDLSCAALIVVVSIGVYANTLQAGFTFDDNFAVVNNKVIGATPYFDQNLPEHLSLWI